MDYSKIPQELRNSARWVLWRLEDVDDKTSGKCRERCKVPYSPRNSSKRASSTDASTWDMLEKAELAFTTFFAIPKYAKEENAVGLGYTFGPPYFGVDIDKCVDTETGDIASWAEAIIAQLPATYTEYSPSRKGFHLWYKCPRTDQLPAGHRTEKMEVYSRGRYFTMTGYHVDSSPATVTELSVVEAQKIFALVESMKEKKSGVTASKTAMYAPDSNKLNQYMTSIDFPDLSAAVQSLLVQLAHKHVLDKNAIEQEFLTSKLYLETHWKDKWTRPSDPLREKELAKAIECARPWIQRDLARGKKKGNPEEEYIWKPVLGCFEDVDEQILEWLWNKRVPKSDATIFAGDPGIGKSLMALDFAARGSVGKEFVDGCENITEPFKTLFLSLEDSREFIMKPRLRVAGADVKMIYFLDMLRALDDDGKTLDERVINLEFDLMRLREAIQSIENLKLVVIDPISNYMGKLSMYNDQELRKILVPIMGLARECQVSIIVVMHNSKQTGRSALAKIGASLGGVGALRIAWSFIENGDSCLMLQAKRNLGKFTGIEYTTETAMLDIKGVKTEQAKMKFIGHSEVNIENLMASKESPKEREQRPAVALIEKMVPRDVDGALASTILDAAKKLGISVSMMTRTRNELGLISTKKKDGWWWRWAEESEAGAKQKDDVTFDF